VTLLEAWLREGNKRGGRPREWDGDRLLDIYLDVEAAKARGKGQRQACVAIAKFYDLKLKVVEKRYTEARKRFHRIGQRYKGGPQEYWSEVLDLHLRGNEQLPGRPHLIEFLHTYKGAAKSPRK
jgi:hypothetical protein